MIIIDIGCGVIDLVNPQIVEKKGRNTLLKEGCLSLPGVAVSVSRRRCVSVKALDKFANAFLIEAEDILVRVLQHQIDQLQGRLIFDYLLGYKRIEITKNLFDN